MPIEPPNADHIQEIAADFGIALRPEDAQSFAGLLQGIAGSYGRLDELVEPKPEVTYPRTAGYRPGPEENPYNAWAWKSTIKGASKGVLAGKTVAAKDNVCVAGLPMQNGSRVMEGYVPEVDATVVSRILDAGGTIVGKTVCEDLCFSGGSHTSKPLPVRNPKKPTHSAGGSSSGSAVAIATGEADMALGGDQGGSIRMPASWCGIYGLKPTYGLVPYTGVFPIELTLDHTGPIAATTVDVALLLEAIAGEDGLDPRQKDVKVEAYTQALANDTEGLRVGIVTEGFGWPGLSEQDVDELVEISAQRFTQLGAQVRKISIPMHRD